MPHRPSGGIHRPLPKALAIVPDAGEATLPESLRSDVAMMIALQIAGPLQIIAPMADEAKIDAATGHDSETPGATTAEIDGATKTGGRIGEASLAPGVTIHVAEMAPVGTAPVGTAPVGTAPVGTAPVGTAPVGTAPVETGLAAIGNGMTDAPATIGAVRINDSVTTDDVATPDVATPDVTTTALGAAATDSAAIGVTTEGVMIALVGTIDAAIAGPETTALGAADSNGVGTIPGEITDEGAVRNSAKPTVPGKGVAVTANPKSRPKSAPGFD